MSESNILLIESGATKANWVFLSDGLPVFNTKTIGLNPYFLDDEEMKNQFYKVKSNFNLKLSFIYFYGTGCSAEDQKIRVSNQLKQVFNPINQPFVDTDILAAARSIGAKKSGLVGILGTGSNACFVNEGQITDTAGGFGFILGDEGSGSALGLTLVRAWLNQELPKQIQLLVDTELKWQKDEIFQAVYKLPFPSRYLAQFATFFFKHKDLTWVQDVVKTQISLFVQKYFLTMIHQETQVQVFFVGSIAHYFSSIVQRVVAENNLSLGKIIQDPMEGLIEFHTTN